MEIKDLRLLVAQGEGGHLEFKLKSAHPEKIVREVVAFANTAGGVLLVGVSDEGSIPGLRYPDEDEYLLTRAIEQLCRPAVPYTLGRVTVSGERQVLVFTVAPGPDKPYYVRAHPTDETGGKAYVRVADRSVQASKEMREVLKGQRRTRNFRFEYGDKERLLMSYLSQKGGVTVDEFVRVAGVTRSVASRTLVLLVLARILRIRPGESGDTFLIVNGEL